VSKLLNDSLEALFGLSTQRLDSRLTAACDADVKLGRHWRASEVKGPVPSESYGIAGEGVLQSRARSRLRESSLIGRLA